ncbi:MAG: AraC family transcriptional regulator [Bacteroidota bacterium]|nr:AraC family transcriptional regulator [Bacteroidota bacterium]
MSEKIPTISICNLLGEDYSIQDIMVYDLKEFINHHKGIKFPHRHSFYQLLFITQGGGTHVIDFEKHEVKKGMIYFLAPSQVHEWLFNSNVNGILINFNENFFSSFLANSHYLADFPFFTANGSHSSIDLSADKLLQQIEQTLLNIQSEFKSCDDCKLDLIKVMLLQIFILVNRKIAYTQNQFANKSNYLVLRNFEKLIEQNYTTMRMPKDYAKLLFVTPNHLNALCNQLTGKSAGDIIRNRVLLEAKRLLVNSNQNINEIAWQLSFEDNSYFSKFFKKYEGITPDEFRKLKY